MKVFSINLKVKLVLKADSKDEVETILQNMNYDFLDPRVGFDDRMNSTIEEWEYHETKS